MAFKRKDKPGTWWWKFVDANGNHVRMQLKGCKTRQQAEALEGELREQLAQEKQNVAEGREADSPSDASTLADVLRWWLETISIKTRSYSRNKQPVGAIIDAIGATKLTALGKLAPAVERYLASLDGRLAAGTINHRRKYLASAVGTARRHGLISDEQWGEWGHKNPILETTRRKVQKRKPAYLTADEIRGILRVVPARWRLVFALAIYTGMRRGEIFALRRGDVNLAAMTLHVKGSWDADMTKSGDDRIVPIAEELVPYLVEGARRHAESPFVCPGSDGGMQASSINLVKYVRRYMAQAGIVEAYVQKCRRKGCGYQATVPPHAETGFCPDCSMKLWPKAVVRPFRFHDLRHTTATQILATGGTMQGAAGVLGHKSVRTTEEVYAHIVPGYLREQVRGLRFQTAEHDEPPPFVDSSRPEAEAPLSSNAESAATAPGVHRDKSKVSRQARPGLAKGRTERTGPKLAIVAGCASSSGSKSAPDAPTNCVNLSEFRTPSGALAGAQTGFAGSCAVRLDILPSIITDTCNGAPGWNRTSDLQLRRKISGSRAERECAQVSDSAQHCSGAGTRVSVGLREDRVPSGALAGPPAGAPRGRRQGFSNVCTVRQAAELLGVCTATVYAMVERNELESFRVRNSIRIPVTEIDRIRGGACER